MSDKTNDGGGFSNSYGLPPDDCNAEAKWNINSTNGAIWPSDEKIPEFSLARKKHIISSSKPNNPQLN